MEDGFRPKLKRCVHDNGPAGPFSLRLISQVGPTLNEMISKLCMPYNAIMNPVWAEMSWVRLIGAELGQLDDGLSDSSKSIDYGCSPR